MKSLSLRLIAAGALCSALYSQPATPPPEPPKAESSISGQVLSAATGEPLRKASVTLSRLDAQQSAPRVKEVDASGGFLFEELEAGRYYLSASRNGYTTQTYGAKRPGGRTGNPITLAARQEMKDLRISLTPHGVVMGRIVDEDGEPRAGVPVSAIKSSWQGNRRQMAPYANATTNDLGEYRLYGVPPGSYWIQAARPRDFSLSAPEASFSARPELDYVTTYYPGTIDASTAAPVTVSSGLELRGIDIKMAKARVVRVRGTVVQSGGGAAMRSFLMMMPKDRGWNASLEMRQAMVIDAKGSFEFRGVTAGQYIIMANFGSQDGQLTALQTINVTDQHVTNLALVLRPGVSLSGTVRVEGQDADKTGSAATNPASSMVLLQPADQGGSGFFGGGNAQVKDDGTFTLKNVQPGRYRVAVYGSEGYLKSARFGAEDVLEGGLEIGEAGPAGALELVRSVRGAEVSGTLLDGKEQPKPGALAVLLPEEKHRDQMDRYSTGTADQYGAFSIKNVRPGQYKLIAVEDVEGTEWMDPEFVRPYEKSAITLKLAEGQKETRQLTVKPRADADGSK